MGQKIKWMIAREGLIIIVIAGILYLARTFAPALACPYPKVKLEFQDGSSHIIEIYPEITAAELAGMVNPNELMRRYQYPGQELISRRINKFIRENKKGAVLVNSRCVNERQLCWYRSYFDFLYQSWPLRTLAIYLFLALFRFIFWAVRFLRKR
ncbi:MAG: hypothetical protein WC478_03745 [Candidatus Omnitrophota bacterium]